MPTYQFKALWTCLYRYYYVLILYQQCRCETLTAYFQNFVHSPCLEYFQCKVVSYLQSLLHASEVPPQLSVEVTSYMQLLERTRCSHYRDSSFFKFLSLMLLSYFTSPTSVMIYTFAYELGLLADSEYKNYGTATHVRVLETILKCLCHLVIFYALNKLMVEVIKRRNPSFRRHLILLGLLLVLGTVNHFTQIQLSYCCHFIPICI